MAEILVLVLKTAFAIVLIATSARFLAQFGRPDPRNPIADTTIRISQPFMGPLRRVVPGVAGFDISGLVVIWAAQAILAALLMGLVYNNNPTDFLGPLLVGALFATLGLILEVLRWSMIIVAIGSWLAGGQPNPLLGFLAQMIEPFVAPFRKLNLQVGVLDLSYILAFMVLYIVKMMLVGVAASTIGNIRILFVGL
ncbi:YggT family protein [Salinispirillum sp. LH 10-3-1]|uniref:YggT family protein n=1 Tax=Salinispirillum sp. LH 10-3-1 TaxID=2952525 RepID=A0AB38YGS4_9GAMM